MRYMDLLTPTYSEMKMTALHVYQYMTLHSQACIFFTMPMGVVCTLCVYVSCTDGGRACSVLAMRRFLPTLGSKDVTYVEVPGAYHDLSHDPETPALVGKMIDWLDTHLSSRQHHKGHAMHQNGKVKNGKSALKGEHISCSIHKSDGGAKELNGGQRVKHLFSRSSSASSSTCTSSRE